MAYCTSQDVNNLFGDISDDITEEMFETVISNSTAWVNSNLKKRFVPIPEQTVDALRTAAIYYSASDILLSLYHGEELPVNYDIWFKKAQDILDAYIIDYLNTEATAEEAENLNMVKHSHAPTYRQKRRRL
jgi:hypothetical protein